MHVPSSRGVVDGSVAPYQASALLMAIVLRGLSEPETVVAGAGHGRPAARRSTSRLIRRPVLDKHSSGGVGDKVTLVLAPLVAACGGVFGKMSGRGLGHTGGTLDKLESIPGFRVQLSQGDFMRQLERIGVAVVSQSERIVPADRILYALRDVTATVESDGPDRRQHHGQEGGQRHVRRRAGPQGRRRAPSCATLRRGARAGPPVRRRSATPSAARVTCLYTAMEAPLGRAVGNRLEVEEAWAVLNGEGPDDVREVALDAGRRAARALGPRRRRGARGAAGGGGSGRRSRRRALRALVLCAGRALEARASSIGSPPRRSRRRAPAYVAGIDAFAVGRAAQLAGAGRQRADDAVDPAAGVVLSRRSATGWRPVRCWRPSSLATRPAGRPAASCWPRPSRVGDEAPAARRSCWAAASEAAERPFVALTGHARRPWRPSGRLDREAGSAGALGRRRRPDRLASPHGRRGAVATP